MQVLTGLPETLRPQAAELYWQAFGRKLGRVMGPEPVALRYLHRVIRPDHCLYIQNDQGLLLGVAGFRSPQGSFVAGDSADMRAIYGRIGAAWRMALIRQLQTDVDNERFLIDGIIVRADHRSKGLGRALIHGLMQEARLRGYPSLRLEVVDSNLRARALYERIGFLPVQSETLGPLRHVFGFTRTTTMIYTLPQRASRATLPE